MKLSLFNDEWCIPGQPTVHLVESDDYDRMLKAEARAKAEDDRREAWVEFKRRMDRRDDWSIEFAYDADARAAELLSKVPPALAVPDVQLRLEPRPVLARIWSDPARPAAVICASGRMVYLLHERRYKELILLSGIERTRHDLDVSGDVVAFEVELSGQDSGWQKWTDGPLAAQQMADKPPKYFKR